MGSQPIRQLPLPRRSCLPAARGGALRSLAFRGAGVRTGETFVQPSIKVTWAGVGCRCRRCCSRRLLRAGWWRGGSGGRAPPPPPLPRPPPPSRAAGDALIRGQRLLKETGAAGRDTPRVWRARRRLWARLARPVAGLVGRSGAATGGAAAVLPAGRDGRSPGVVGAVLPWPPLPGLRGAGTGLVLRPSVLKRLHQEGAEAEAGAGGAAPCQGRPLRHPRPPWPVPIGPAARPGRAEGDRGAAAECDGV